MDNLQLVEIPTKTGRIEIGKHVINKYVKPGSCYLLIWEGNLCVRHEHGLTWEEILKEWIKLRNFKDAN